MAQNARTVDFVKKFASGTSVAGLVQALGSKPCGRCWRAMHKAGTSEREPVAHRAGPAQDGVSAAGRFPRFSGAIRRPGPVLFVVSRTCPIATAPVVYPLIAR